MRKIIKNGKVLIGKSFQELDILIEEGKISALEQGSSEEVYEEILDAKGQVIIPGMIDIHTHGGNGIDFNHATKEDVFKVSQFFAEKGVTSYLPTILTDTQETMCQLLATIAEVKEEQEASKEKQGASILGIHMEGPFLCSAFKGAMPEHLIRQGSVEDIKMYQQASKNTIRYMTVSVENKGALEVIHYLKEQGIVASIGHTGAEYEKCIACIEAGAASSTHVFNAMGSIHQHRPSAIGAALETDIYSEMICDGFHLHPGIVRLMIKAKGKNKVIAITDSIMAAGLSDGNYKLGVNDIVVKNGDAQLATDGVRAGSTLTLDKALRNLKTFTHKPMEELIAFMTLNPATLLGVEDRKGSIEIGKDADLVILDANGEPCMTMVEGSVVYRK